MPPRTPRELISHHATRLSAAQRDLRRQLRTAARKAAQQQREQAAPSDMPQPGQQQSW